MDTEERSKRCPDCGEVVVGEACSHCGWHAGEISLKRWEIEEICSEIKKNEASPSDARRLYQAFRELVEQDQPVPHQLLKWLASASARISKRGLELSFKRRGAPRATGLHQQMAMMVLELRLSGATFDEAIKRTTAAAGKWDRRSVERAWAKYGRDALVELQAMRAVSGKQWTLDELSRLEEQIFSKMRVVDTCPKCSARRFAEICDAPAVTCLACGWHPPLSLSEGSIAERH
jgi:hypothetical protein